MATLLDPPKGFVVEPSFDPIFNRTLKLEGINPNENELGASGVSKFGVTQQTFDSFNDAVAKPRRDVRTATQQEAKQIFKENFFEKNKVQ